MPSPSAAAEPSVPGTGGLHAAAVSARNLKVTYRSKAGPVEALRGVDLDIPKGSLFALLGPNGAGKTTLMRCITGLVEPTSGTLAVLGAGERGSRARLARMGVLIENPGQYGRLDAREYLAFFGSFYAIPDLKDRIRDLCGEFGLDLDGKPVAKLSQGNRQKLQLARSLLHRPELLLWDEPTDHLDPMSQRAVLTYLRGYLSGSGATALVASHRLEQIETVATHFGFLAHGNLKAAGDKARILEGAGSGGMGQGVGREPCPKREPGLERLERAQLGFARPLGAEETAKLDAGLSERFAARLQASPADGTRFDVAGPGLRERMPELIRAVVEWNLPLSSAQPYRDALSDIYQRWVEP
jgi:ABC-2 type transport system ATP-binding protein